MAHIRGPIAAILVAGLLTACTTSAPGPPEPTRPASSGTHSGPSHRPPPSDSGVPTAVGKPGCDPSSEVGKNGGVPEIHGAGRTIQMWGLVMAAKPFAALHVREDVKIVWRITGHGPLHLSSIDPDGRTHQLQWGPDLHSGSNYARPGQEWGAGYRFGEPGCWTLRAVRAHATADAWVRVIG
jgi:hypothetical protein